MSADAVAGLAVGAGLGAVFAFGVVWYILQIIGNWKLFKKAGKPGWHSIVPFLNIYDEYDMCWNGGLGIVFLLFDLIVNVINASNSQNIVVLAIAGILAIITLVLHIMQSLKLSKAFGHGVGYGIFLIIFDRLGRLILGFGSSEYQGKDA